MLRFPPSRVRKDFSGRLKVAVPVSVPAISKPKVGSTSWVGGGGGGGYSGGGGGYDRNGGGGGGSYFDNRAFNKSITVSPRAEQHGKITFNSPEGVDSANFPATITVTGDDPFYLELEPVRGVPYDDPGVHAKDYYQNDIDVETLGIVNHSLPGTYLLNYQATDQFGQVVTAQRTVIVYYRPPVFSSNSSTSITFEEGKVDPVDRVLTESPREIYFTYAITGGADQALFSIDSATGELSFLNPPDFENPIDGNADNIYEVSIAASWDTMTETSNMTVEVTDLKWNESPASFRFEFGLNADGSDDLKDQSGNGIPNILYFLLGLGDPAIETPQKRQPGSTGLPRIEIDEEVGLVSYTYTVHRNQTEFDIFPEVSSSLQEWSNPLGSNPGPFPVSIETVPLDIHYNQVTLSFLTESNVEFPDATIYPQVFFRLQATPN